MTQTFNSLGLMMDDLGIICTQRSRGIVNVTSMPDDSDPPELDEDEALQWMTVFQRHRIMMILNMSNAVGTLELSPFDTDADPFEVSLLPGTLVLARCYSMGHKLFSASTAYVL